MHSKPHFISKLVGCTAFHIDLKSAVFTSDWGMDTLRAADQSLILAVFGQIVSLKWYQLPSTLDISNSDISKYFPLSKNVVEKSLVEKNYLFFYTF